MSLRVLLSCKGKPAPLESLSGKKGQFCHDFLHCAEFRSRANANTSHSLCSSTRAGNNQLSLALWHYQKNGSKSLQTPLLLNEPGLMMWERSRGQQKEEIRKEKVHRPPPTPHSYSQLVSPGMDLHPLWETKAAPAERSSCLSWTGKHFLYALSSTPNSPKLRPCQAFALLGRPLCWVSSIDATLPRPVLSTCTLKIHLSL